jgi:alkylation response protein AidB-like acyl-CoA dehydrogenase
MATVDHAPGKNHFDPIGAFMDLTLTAEQQAFRALVRDFLDREVVPHRARWDRDEGVDTELLPLMAEIGVFGLTVPEEWGGSAADYLTYALMMEELGRADSAVRGIVSVSLGLVATPVATFGTDEQKKQWLTPLAEGRALGCFGLTEPDTGSDAGQLRSRAERQGDEYLINGSKMFITNGSWADVCLLFARTGGPGPRGISAFLVPTAAPGFARREIRGKLGLRGQATAELTLTDVRVPASSRLGDEGQGFSIAMTALDKGRVSVAAGCVGIVQACLDAVVDYARTRTQFGRPIASFQMVQDMIAEISVDADAARLLVWRAVDLIERGEPFGLAATKAKYFASEAAVRASNLAIQAFGGYGYVDEYPVQKFMRDARVMTLYEGTSQIQKLLIGRAETGISAFV